MAALLLAIPLGLSAGTGVRVSMFVWIIFPLFGLLPQAVQSTLFSVVMNSARVPVLAVLLAALLLDRGCPRCLRAEPGIQLLAPVAVTLLPL